jgi:polyphosphate kinase
LRPAAEKRKERWPLHIWAGERGLGQKDRNEGFARIRLKRLDLVRNNLDALFPGMTVLEVMPFRVTRNAEVDHDDDDPAESVAETVEAEIRQRRFEEVIRLEYGPVASSAQLQLLTHKLALGEADLYQMPGELDFTALFHVANTNLPELRYRPWHPVVPAVLADERSDIFSVIRAGDFLVHHPYESFDATVERFLHRAASDPKVLAIKMTVYRVGSDTPFLDALTVAAEAGKQVACLVEVTARFDERANLRMAQSLEKSGVHVVYGMVGLKTHCKTASWWGDKQLGEARAKRSAGEVMKEGGHVVGQVRIAGEQAHVGLEPGCLDVIVAGADMGVAAEAVVVLAVPK